MAYTFAKTISDSDILAGGGPAGQTTYNRRLEKAIATTDVPHVFALSYSYELPFFRQNRWIGGWVLTGIHQYSSGTPIQLSANNTLPLFTGILRPDVVNDAPRRSGTETFDPAADRWINPAAFRVPAALQFGTAARSYTDLRNPTYLNENFGLLKRFRLAERLTLTFRAEWFNAFNRVNYNNPATVVTNTTFGTISTAKTPRELQFSLRYQF